MNTVKRNERSPSFYKFKIWFKANQDSIDVPPYKILAKQYKVSKSCIGAWIKELGGFKHKGGARGFKLRVENAIKYMKGCTQSIGVKALMVKAGYTPDSTAASAKRFLTELKKRSPETYAKIKLHQRDVNSDEELLKWGRRFKRKHKRSPMMIEVAERIGRSPEYAAERVDELVAKYPHGPFKPGDEARIEKIEVDLVKKYTAGSRDHVERWRKKVTYEYALGFDFKGEYWTRYLLIWNLKRRGFEWSGNPTGDINDGRAKRLGVQVYMPIDEALAQKVIR